MQKSGYYDNWSLPLKNPQGCWASLVAPLVFSDESAFLYRLDAVLGLFLLRVQLSYINEI